MWPKSRIAGVPAFDTTDAAQLLQGMRLARAALKRGELVVIPTDTVYGIAAEAFAAPAVQRLLDAKGATARPRRRCSCPGCRPSTRSPRSCRMRCGRSSASSGPAG
ncbi:hypothetical protein GCM10025881_05100 [Pseudolysinimonas kribbensis]|uniref:YrdC-like domain-containing protein n=1 Tax=Pseudolysinimonas kribbensis TaxID=433641 RepID=A0ABQ6JZC6_9MICO|nr:hypothetical protein GCM10025881_05100 [Pseudolysinimonas kribbensis]